MDYRIVSAEKLMRLMNAAGFKKLKIYGNFEFAEFKYDVSENIIILGG